MVVAVVLLGLSLYGQFTFNERHRWLRAMLPVFLATLAPSAPPGASRITSALLLTWAALIVVRFYEPKMGLDDG